MTSLAASLAGLHLVGGPDAALMASADVGGSPEHQSPFSGPNHSSSEESVSPGDASLLHAVSLSGPGSNEDLARQQDGRNSGFSLDGSGLDGSFGRNSVTLPCFDFTKGVCTRGDKCKYSHDLTTIVNFNSKEKGICFDYLRNQCQRGLLCRFSHDLSHIAQQCHVASVAANKGRTTAVCYDFVKGVCQRGNDCRYSHDLSLIARTARGASQKSGELCYDYLRGRCNRGASCKYSHNISFLAAPGMLGQALGSAGQGGNSSGGGMGSNTSGGGSAGMPQGGPHGNSNPSGPMPGMPPQPQLPLGGAPSLTGGLPPGLVPDAQLAMSAPLSSLQSALAGELAPKHPLTASLSSEFNDTRTGHTDQPNGGVWPAGPAVAAAAAAVQAQALTSMAMLNQQRHIAAAAAAAAAAASLSGLNHHGGPQGPGAIPDMLAKPPLPPTSGFAAAAVQQQALASSLANQQHPPNPAAAFAMFQQQQQQQQGPHGHPPGPYPPGAAAAVANLARAHSAPVPMPLPGGAPMTADSISALLSSLGNSDPKLLAETLTNLAVAAQAQAARMSGSGVPMAGPQQPNGPPPPMMASTPRGNPPPNVPLSAPKPIPGRADPPGPGAPGMHPHQMGSSYTDGYGPAAAAAAAANAMLTASASLPGPEHLTRAMSNPLGPSALSPDLLPLLKEIWNK